MGNVHCQLLERHGNPLYIIPPFKISLGVLSEGLTNGSLNCC